MKRRREGEKTRKANMYQQEGGEEVTEGEDGDEGAREERIYQQGGKERDTEGQEGRSMKERIRQQTQEGGVSKGNQG